MIANLSQSPVSGTFVSGRHQSTAEGICHQNGIYYQQATTISELQQGLLLQQVTALF